jgi:hypothetical protein
MKKLFTDKETFVKERPTKITKQQEQDYHVEVAEEIINNGWSKCPLEDVIQDISKISANDSGYEIAKKLEGTGKKAHYSIDTEFIGYLDSFGYYKERILSKNVEAWAKAHSIKPMFSIGQKLIVEISLNRQKKTGAVVYVTGYSESQACYLIDVNPKREGGTVIAYEKVESHCSYFIC